MEGFSALLELGAGFNPEYSGLGKCISEWDNDRFFETGD